MNYQGDITLGDTLDIKFTTVSTTGVPTTLTGSPVVSAYVGNGTTEITAGITLTVDFDARTGLHNVRVVASSGNGFATASDVNLVITTGTVGGASVVGYVIGSFSIGKRSTGGGGGGDASQATLLAVKAKTDNLPTDPADASDIASSFSTVNLKLDAIDDFVDVEVGAIKAKTDQLVFSGGKVDANATLAITAGDLTAIADAILKRDFSAITGEAAYSLLNAARMLRCAWSTTGGILVVKKEDGSTNAWSRPLATDPAAEPIVGAS